MPVIQTLKGHKRGKIAKGFTKDMTRLAIIAGKGQLPIEVAAAATAGGFDVLMLPIDGQADADCTAYHTMPIRLGAIGETRAIMVQHKIEKLVMVGKVSWPSMAALRPDFDGVKLLGKMMTKGDDNALRNVAAYFAEKGVETMAVDAFCHIAKCLWVLSQVLSLMRNLWLWSPLVPRLSPHWESMMLDSQ